MTMKIVDGGTREFLKTVFVEPAEQELKLYAEFSDGTSGEVDLSKAAKLPVFRKAWQRGRFREVWIDGDCLCWGKDNHIDPEYLKDHLTEMTYEAWTVKESSVLAKT